jgi:hypothetical protein
MFFLQIIVDNLKGGRNIIGVHSFDMVNFNMHNKLYIGEMSLSLENSTGNHQLKNRLCHYTLFINQSVHKTEEIKFCKRSLHGNFVFITFFAAAEVPNTSKMLWTNRTFVAVARTWKPPSIDSS